MDLIVGIVGIIIVWQILRLLVRTARSPRQNLMIEAAGDYSCEVVGESHYQGALERIVGGRTEDSANYRCVAQIVPEPTNRHDRNAMRIDIEGKTVGYLSRWDAKTLRKMLRKQRVDGPVSANAIIIGGWARGKRDVGHFGVRLDVPLDEAINVVPAPPVPA